MKNPLLVPEFRDMLSSHHVEEIQDFCNSTDPSIVADFLGALSPQEVLVILLNLSPEIRSSIFVFFDEDVKLFLIDLMEQDELVELVTNMADEERFNFLKKLSNERQVKIKTVLEQAQRDDVWKVFSQLEIAAEFTISSELIKSEEIPEIDIYKTRDNKLEKITKIEKDCWINVVSPGQEELNFLSQQFNIPYDFLTASLDIDEIARTEIENNITLIILKTPFFDKDSPDVFYFTVPIGIILANDLIITICSKESEIILDFIKNRVKNFSTVKRYRFVLQLFLRTTLLYLQYLKQINNAANIIQKKLEQSSKNMQLIKLLNIEKSLVYFTTSLKSNAFMLERLQKMNVLGVDAENKDLFEDITTESKQAIEMANIYSDILSGMMDAFASIISNNLNIVMKALTLITIIITIPILLASLYGMNVKLPLQDSPYAFLIVILASIVLALIGISFFIKRKWL
ncbi:MAG: CorA family divalent cation transporter [Pseudomonadota bacterium]